MEDQTDLHSEDLNFFSSTMLQQKHVRFAEHPVIFKNVCFHFTPKLTNTNWLIQKPTESCLKNLDDYVQVTEYNDLQFTKCSIFTFLLLLSFLFFLIWWMVSKLLMVEIDTQLGEYLMNQMVKQSSS